MTFHAGQTVECINDNWGAFAQALTILGGIGLPVKGGKYVVTNVYSGAMLLHACPALEFSNFPGVYAGCHFRPIVARKTDISVFTEMLTPKTVNV